MAEIIRYVDTDSAGGNGTTTALSGANAAYATLAACLAAEKGDWVTATNWLHIYCKASAGAADTAHVSIADADWVTGASNYILIEAAETDKAGASWSTSKYRLSRATGAEDGVIFTSGEFVRFKGIQIHQTSVAEMDKSVVILNSANSSVVHFDGCIIRGPAGSANRGRGIYLWGTSVGTVHVWNTMIYDCSTRDEAGSTGAYLNCTNGVFNMYNCIVAGGRHGVLVYNGTITTKNTYVGVPGAAFARTGGTLAKVNCAASDTTATATGTGHTATNCIDSVAYSTDTLTNVTAGSEDFHLAGTGSALYRTGTDTSGDSAPMNFTTDIDGDTYYSTRSIGADEYVAAATATNVVLNII